MANLMGEVGFDYDVGDAVLGWWPRLYFWTGLSGYWLGLRRLVISLDLGNLLIGVYWTW
jgi:hypothetical protein